MFDISEKGKLLIQSKMECFYTELINKYDSQKYNEAEYDRLCSAFNHPDKLDLEEIEKALAWKYGKTIENLRKNEQYDGIIESLKNIWGSYTKEKITDGKITFEYLYKQVGSSFISVAFISHLVFPKDIPIVDQHTFRGVRYYLSIINYENNIKLIPNSLSEIIVLKNFVSDFSKTLKVNEREFDKYLMMFGKHVAPR